MIVDKHKGQDYDYETISEGLGAARAATRRASMVPGWRRAPTWCG